MSTDDACQQRKLFMQFNIPPTRLTKQSPYNGTVTQEQLNMRRKAEILKYKKNAGGSSTSQKQNFARIARGNYNIARVPCPADALIPTSSKNSNIPGPEIFLYEDPNVPLYNYFTETNTGGIGQQIDTTEWSVYLNQNVRVPENTDTTMATLVIRESISRASLIYSLQIPVSLRVSGSNYYTDTSGSIINVSEINPTVRSYYNGNLNSTAVSSILQQNKVTLRLHPTTDIVTSNNLETYSFLAVIFIGYLNVSDLLIYTSPGNVFDLKKYFVTTKTLDILTNDVTYVNSSQTNVINGVDFGIMINQTSDKNRNLLVNCALENPEIVDMTNPRSFSISDNIGNTSSTILAPINIINYKVTVQEVTDENGTSNKFYLNNVMSPAITIQGDKMYKFDLSDSSNSTHQLLFSTTSDGIHGSGVEYTTNITKVGTAGSPGSYISFLKVILQLLLFTTIVLIIQKWVHQ